MTLQRIIAEISENNSGEFTAIEGYFNLLSAIKENNLPFEFYKDVEEIISDEMNHATVLSKWITMLSKIQPNET